MLADRSCGAVFPRPAPRMPIAPTITTCAPQKLSPTDSTPLRAVCETQATVAPLDAPPPPRRFTHTIPPSATVSTIYLVHTTLAHAPTYRAYTHHARTYCTHSHTHRHTHTHTKYKTRRRWRQRASERSSRGGRRVPPVDGEPLWSMAAPSSGGGGRRADDVSNAVVPLAAAAPTTTTTTNTPSKMPPLQRPTGGSRLADTQVAAADKSHRRKISLPWFRQTSTSTAAAALARQHTIDTPGSYRHRSIASRSSAATTAGQVFHSRQ